MFSLSISVYRSNSSLLPSEQNKASKTTSFQERVGRQPTSEKSNRLEGLWGCDRLYHPLCSLLSYLVQAEAGIGGWQSPGTPRHSSHLAGCKDEQINTACPLGSQSALENSPQLCRCIVALGVECGSHFVPGVSPHNSF